MAQFVLGFCIISEQQKPALSATMTQHLMELMKDAEKYSWPVVRNYHGVWLQQLEVRREREPHGTNLMQNKGGVGTCLIQLLPSPLTTSRQSQTPAAQATTVGM